MIKKITIVTTGHPPFDERIYWKFAGSLSSSGFEISIICASEEINFTQNNIIISGFDGTKVKKRKKLSRIYEMLNKFMPEVVICCEPLIIFPVYKYRKLRNDKCIIISDITEWYPENIAFKNTGIKKFLYYWIAYKLNTLASNLANHLIIGEISKKKRYDKIAPLKKKTIIGYYPVLKYFSYFPPPFDGKRLTLCYAGLINFERGILTLLEIAEELSTIHYNLEVRLKIIGKFQYKHEEEKFIKLISQKENIIVEMVGWVKYTEISDQLKDVDICFDLRKKTFIYKNSLPIKIFEYLASGKPVIYSDIIPIRKEFEKINFGYLVEPNDKEKIIKIINNYINNRLLLITHSHNAREVIEKGKNWENESKKLIELITSLN
ncbi:MAG TPA: glycosyltransferase [Ignavibacteria bacterium]|nr:glycosyltransferase [Ignavibacteria bacterium]